MHHQKSVAMIIKFEAFLIIIDETNLDDFL